MEKSTINKRNPKPHIPYKFYINASEVLDTCADVGVVICVYMLYDNDFDNDSCNNTLLAMMGVV